MVALRTLGYRSLILLCLFSVGGCAGHINRVMSELDSYWNAENQKILKTKGTRVYESIDIPTAQRAMLITMRNLNMVVEEQDFESGFILARAAAPKPLTEEEWQEVSF